MRGDVHVLKRPRGVQGHEQDGTRYGVIVQSDELFISTTIVAPTSRSAPSASYRPIVTIAGEQTKVLAEQAMAIDFGRLGQRVGHLTYEELREVDAALRLVMALD